MWCNDGRKGSGRVYALFKPLIITAIWRAKCQPDCKGQGLSIISQCLTSFDQDVNQETNSYFIIQETTAWGTDGSINFHATPLPMSHVLPESLHSMSLYMFIIIIFSLIYKHIQLDYIQCTQNANYIPTLHHFD